MAKQNNAIYECKPAAMKNQEEFEILVEYIHSAIESEQSEPKEFLPETELRLRLVYTALRRAFDLPDPL
jgi:hypothetical protein